MRLIARAALALALVAGSMTFGGATTTAEAACKSCKQAGRTVVKTNTVYKNVVKRKRVVKYKDVRRTNYVNVVNRTRVVTRVIPVTHVHTVTRVHRHTVYQHRRETVRGGTVTGKGRTTYSASTVVGRASSSRVSCCSR